LLQRRPELTEGGLGLCDLVIQFGGHDLGQQLSSLHPVTDVDFALGDVAAGAGKDICGRERRRRGGQTDGLDAVARLHRRDTYLRDKVAALLCRGDH
jgi:hypothetical protein